LSLSFAVFLRSPTRECRFLAVALSADQLRTKVNTVHSQELAQPFLVLSRSRISAMSTLVYTVLAISGLYVFFDVSYFLRGVYMWLRWKGAITDESKGILEESVQHSKRLHKRVSLYASMQFVAWREYRQLTVYMGIQHNCVCLKERHLLRTLSELLGTH